MFSEVQDRGTVECAHVMSYSIFGWQGYPILYELKKRNKITHVFDHLYISYLLSFFLEKMYKLCKLEEALLYI